MHTTAQRKYHRLIKQFTELGHICNGSLKEMYRTCGKPGCRNTRSIDTGLKIIAKTRRRPPRGQCNTAARNTRCTSLDHNIRSGCRRLSLKVSRTGSQAPARAGR